MELKTLKEIFEENYVEIESDGRCCMDILKQEAIKWVKEDLKLIEKKEGHFKIKSIKNNGKQIEWDGTNSFNNITIEMGRAMGFIQFFNINDEDLK